MHLKNLVLFLALLLSSGCMASRTAELPATLERSDSGAKEPRPQPFESQEGLASFYAKTFYGKKTASGEILNSQDRTAAHLSLPFGTIVQVTNLENGKKTTVRINDRGPFVKGRIIDLSIKAARELDVFETGTPRVRIYIMTSPNMPLVPLVRGS